jgi:hypothetical protein
MQRRRMLLASTFSLVGLVSSEPAHADVGFTATAPPHDDVDRWQRKLAVTTVFGFGTPVGYYGLAFEVSPTPVFVASLGMGVGSGPLRHHDRCLPSGHVGVCTSPWYESLQYALLGRVRVVRTRDTAISFGGGPSTGGYHWTELTTDGPSHKTATRAYWMNVEASLEGRTAGGLSGRLFLGYAFMLNPGALGCVEGDASSSGHCLEKHRDDGKQLLYLGGAIGFAF